MLLASWGIWLKQAYIYYRANLDESKEMIVNQTEIYFASNEV